jgi:hypothetical protein
MLGMQPSEKAIQLRMSQIELARQTGQPLDPSQMDSAGKIALKRLMSPPLGAPAPSPVSSTVGIQPLVNPAHGNWDDAEAELEDRRKKGLPVIK